MLHSPKPPVGEPVPALLVEKKFGLKDNMRAVMIAEPGCIDPAAELDPLTSPQEIPAGAQYDYIHLYVRHAASMEDRIAALIPHLAEHAMLWVSFPNWTSPLFIDVTDEEVRNAALPFGLVDVKTRDDAEDWRALKFISRHSL